MNNGDSNILLEARNISKIYKSNNIKDSSFYALRDVSFTLKKNESLGLIGNNGSGKSTLLKMAAGLIKPSSGSLTINGKINSLIEIGSNFVPDLNGYENVKFFLKMNNVANEDLEEIISKVHGFSELGDFFYEPVKYYSSGMFIRLAMSAGFYIEADIFLIDEVLMAGDFKFREKVSKRFDQLIVNGKGIILASHNPEEISKNTQNCIWLDKGIIVKREKSSDALKSYYIEYANKHAFKRKEINKAIKQKNEQNANKKNQIASNAFIKLNQIEVLNRDALTEFTSITLKFSVEKLSAEYSLFPVVKIFSVLLKPLLAVSSTLDNDCLNYFESIGKTQAKFVLTTTIPPNLLSPGTYYYSLVFIEKPVSKDGVVTERYSSEGFDSFTIQKTNSKDFTSDSLEIYVKPQANWKIS